MTRPEEYFLDPERIGALLVGAVIVLGVALIEHRLTRGLDRWLWWRP